VATPEITAEEIALAVSNIFVNKLSPVQSALLLYNLSLTGLEQRPDVLARCATAMRAAASELDFQALEEVIRSKNLRSGNYQGGLVRNSLLCCVLISLLYLPPCLRWYCGAIKTNPAEASHVIHSMLMNMGLAQAIGYTRDIASVSLENKLITRCK